MNKAGGSDSKNTRHCTFCGKSQHEVRKLIAGPTVFICDECVELCMDIVGEENKSSLVKSGEGIPAPKQICKVLDDYVIGQDHAKKVLSRGVINRKHVRDSDDPANSASREYPFVLSGDVIEPRLVAAMPPLPMFEPERRTP